jgi:hypothetical protein
MRSCIVCAFVTCVVFLGRAQQSPTPATSSPAARPGGTANSPLSDMFEAKIKVEWEALKNKDKKSYADLLADDYQGVEVDGKGERNKTQAVNELIQQNVANYSLWGFKLIPLEPNAAMVIYESTIQFPPQAQIRLSRVYISELWVKREGQWKEVHYQETRVK